MIAAKLTKPALDDLGRVKRDDDGKPILQAKYTGLHMLRHFYASFCINRKQMVDSNSRRNWFNKG